MMLCLFVSLGVVVGLVIGLRRSRDNADRSTGSVLDGHRGGDRL